MTRRSNTFTPIRLARRVIPIALILALAGCAILAPGPGDPVSPCACDWRSLDDMKERPT